ncbi:MAG: TatD family hydrolase [Candidatus Babeliales bacterium]|nr:TatD family hydrolase [Candidatus Babeliales bacterium]
MLIDTHSHINIMVKKTFDTLMQAEDFINSRNIINEAATNNVTKLINVGTSLIESINCIELANRFENVYAAIGIHPNDLTGDWKKELNELKKELLNKKSNKIVAVGECGVDKHYPDFNLQRQEDAFKAQIELALENNLAIIVHSRDAYDETLKILEEYKNNNMRGVIHCFSEDLNFAKTTISWWFVIGIGGTLTYPKNNTLREVANTVSLNDIVLETDAPFLPSQSMRGKQNHPQNILIIAEYLAALRNISLDEVAKQTTDNVERIFRI